MLTSKCIWSYRKQFCTNDCTFAEPGNNVMIIDPDTGKTHISPDSETEKDFMDRLDRSKREHRNLFFEEWEEFAMKPGVIY